MNLFPHTSAQIGLILDILGIVLVTIESSWTLRGIRPNQITAYDPNPLDSKIAKIKPIGYVLLFLGFIFQYAGSSVPAA